MTSAPASRPCGSCPYRRDVPSGVWSADEYAKLPPYDNDTPGQPFAAFFCHQQDGRLCAGWVGCHDMRHSLGLRMALATGAVAVDECAAVLSYSTDVELFASGAEAAAHGMRDVAEPGERAVRVIDRLATRQDRKVESD